MNGLGKTIQALGVFNALPNARSMIVVCPASLKLNWLREAEKWLVAKDYDGQMRKPVIGIGANQFIPSADILIVNFEILGAKTVDGSKQLRREIRERIWDLIVIDEAHRLKEASTQRAKFSFAIKGKHSLLLTGTPLPNRPRELWPLLNYLAPHVWSNKWTFLQKHCYAGTRFGHANWDGAHELEFLQSQMRANIMVRRLKSEVLKELPPKRRQVIEIPANGLEHLIRDERERYARIMREHAQVQKRREELKVRVELAKVAEDKAEFERAVQELQECRSTFPFEEISRIRAETAIAKLPAVIEHLETVIEETGKVVCFAHHKEVIKGIEKHFGEMCVSVYGDVKMDDRQRNVDRFQVDPECKLFIGGILAAGVGLTLTASSTVVFAELDWVPGNVTQAEDRCLVKDSLVFCLHSAYNEGMSLTNIQNIKAGDIVLTHEGREKRVTSTYEKEHRGLITKIHYVGWHEPLTCTHDHKILVKRDGLLQWLPAHKLLPSDAMAFPKATQTVRLHHVLIKDKWRLYKTGIKATYCIVGDCAEPIEARSMCRIHYRASLKSVNRPAKPMQINPRYVRLPDIIHMTDEWLYLLGWYVAEGFASLLPGKSRFVSFSGHQDERRVLERIGKTLGKLGIKTTIYEKQTSKGIEMRAYSGELAFWFRDWFGHLAHNKTLPKEIMSLCPEQAATFLRGYTDGDGYQRGRQVEWVSASRTLCYQMCLLAIRAGFIPTMRVVRRKTERHHDQWIGGYTKFSKCDNHRLTDQDERYVYRPLRKVETENAIVKVYDLTVEDDHSFTTGFATAHNCHRIGQEAGNVLIQHIVLEGSIDSKMVHTIIRKQDVADRALDLMHAGSDDPELVERLKEDAETIELPEQLEYSDTTAQSGAAPRRFAPEHRSATHGTTREQLERKAAELKPEEIHLIHYGLKRLAEVCDGAVSRDDHGFNGTDSNVGRELARRDTLSPLAAALGFAICKKYNKSQLNGALDSLYN